MLVSLSNIES